MASLPLSQPGLDTSVPRGTARFRDSDLQPRRAEIFEPRADKTMCILGAAALQYRSVIRVIDAAEGAGVSRIGIITNGMRAATARSVS